MSANKSNLNRRVFFASSITGWVLLTLISCPIRALATKLNFELTCPGQFKTKTRSEVFSYDLNIEWDEQLQILTVKSLKSELAESEFLKFGLLPAPIEISQQNPLLVGVQSLADLKRPERKLLFVPFSQMNFQKDQLLSGETPNILRFETELSPLKTGITGYFLARRSMSLNLGKRTLEYSVDGRDYFDAEAVKKKTASYKVISGVTETYDGYSFSMNCRSRASHSM